MPQRDLCIEVRAFLLAHPDSTALQISDALGYTCNSSLSSKLCKWARQGRIERGPDLPSPYKAGPRTIKTWRAPLNDVPQAVRSVAVQRVEKAPTEEGAGIIAAALASRSPIEVAVQQWRGGA